ncbi:MAG: hypothetical protein QOF89_1640 [Acidobacteriota bacterium]|jgi:hypothetical protein|nr:hypothetical protein [Acidobacteriota bacterium]
MPSSQRRSRPERQRRWDLLISARQRILETLPHLDEDLGELESIQKNARALVAKQVYYLGKAREVTAKLQALGKRGDRLRGRIGASLRGRHGYDALELIAYGFKPRRAKISTKETESLNEDPTDGVSGGIPSE